jgi:hypothetical protein
LIVKPLSLKNKSLYQLQQVLSKEAAKRFKVLLFGSRERTIDAGTAGCHCIRASHIAPKALDNILQARPMSHRAQLSVKLCREKKTWL